MRQSNNGKLAVLWDMDGVLVDTGESHYQTWSKIFADMQVPFDREIFRQSFGMNNFLTLQLVTGQTPDPQAAAELSAYKEKIWRAEIHGKLELLPGVERWLAYFKQQGIRQAVASSAPPENIDAVVDDLNIRGYFDELVSGSRIAGKPDPAVFLLAAGRLAAEPARCTVVEDSIAGVQAAKSAGMRCIAVTNTNPREALADADLVVGSLEDLRPEDFSA